MWGLGESAGVQVALCSVHCALCSVLCAAAAPLWVKAGLMHWRGHRGRVQLGLCVVLCPVLCHRLGLCTALCSTLCCAVHQAVHQGYTMHWSHALELLYVLEPCHILGPHTRAVLCSWTVHWGCSQCCSCAPWLGCALGHALGLCCAPRPCTRSTTHSGAAQQGHAMH